MLGLWLAITIKITVSVRSWGKGRSKVFFFYLDLEKNARVLPLEPSKEAICKGCKKAIFSVLTKESLPRSVVFSFYRSLLFFSYVRVFDSIIIVE